MQKILFYLFMLPVLAGFSVHAQNNNVQMGIVGDKFSDFTLTTFQGEKISTQDLRGKNILLVIPRGKYKDNEWCTICMYQYAEWAELELTQQIRKKYNLEIVFLFPYNKDSIAKWVNDFPKEITRFKEWKNPSNPEKLSDGEKWWMNFTRTHFPKDFDYKDKNVPLPLPIVLDDKQEVSKGLNLSRTEWDGSKTLQNIPAVFIINKEGILKFKYISQATIDRPSSEYIMEIMDKILK